MENTFNFGQFVRECYLRSNPSVDLDKVSAKNPIKCSDHKLLVCEYEKILAKFGVENQTKEMEACNMWMLMSGPSLVN